MHWVIGDIHGMLRPLDALLGAIGRLDPAARLVFAGDYVNRGPDSRRVIDRLLSLERAAFVRGNHDDVFDLLVNGECYICQADAPDAMSAFAWFMQYGLAETLMSYGADWAELQALLRRPNPRGIEALGRLVPPAHRAFVRALRPVFETEDFFVVHGFWSPDEPDAPTALSARLAAQVDLRQPLLWGRFTERQIDAAKRWRRTGYFGHTPVTNYPSGIGMEPVRGPKIVLLDTAAALNVEGRLTAVCTETGAAIQADRAGDLIELPAPPRGS